MPLLKLRPACKNYLWGGDRLRTDYRVDSNLHPLAEAWVLSCHPDGLSIICNGDYAGKSLRDFLGNAGIAALGTDCSVFKNFPVLIKLIDAKDNLSIQVHPSDEYALAHEHQYGKTEMWYILDCDRDSFLYYGFKQAVSQEEFAHRISNQTLTEILNAVPVHKGDVFFIPSGTLHAIGKGILIAEIQQNSNVTYRVYDYGRVGADGKPRDLHIAQALEVTRRDRPKPYDFGNHLGKCKYFTVDLHRGAFATYVDGRSFVSLLFIEGQGNVNCAGEILSVQKGDSLFVPAGSGMVQVTGNTTTLLTYV